MVYIVYGYYEGDWLIDAIFSSKKSAEEYMQDQMQHCLRVEKDYHIEEHEVYD